MQDARRDLSQDDTPIRLVDSSHLESTPAPPLPFLAFVSTRLIPVPAPMRAAGKTGCFTIFAVDQLDRRAVRLAESLLGATAPGGIAAVGLLGAARRPS